VIRAWATLLLLLATGDGAAAARVDGEILHADNVVFRGLRFGDVAAVPHYEAQTIRFTDLEARAYGGRVTGTLSVALDDGSVALDLQLQDWDLGRFMRRYADSDAELEGRIDGRVQLRVPAAQWTRASGSARLTLREGAVVDVSGLARLIAGNPQTGQRSDSGEAEIRIEDGVLHIRSAHIDNVAYRIEAQGRIDAEGRVDVTVSPFARLEHFRAVPGLGDLAKAMLSPLSGRLARFTIEGPISDPEFDASPF